MEKHTGAPILSVVQDAGGLRAISDQGMIAPQHSQEMRRSREACSLFEFVDCLPDLADLAPGGFGYRMSEIQRRDYSSHLKLRLPPRHSLEDSHFSLDFRIPTIRDALAADEQIAVLHEQTRQIPERFAPCLPGRVYTAEQLQRPLNAARERIP